jgi:hypothetical protein
MQAPARQRRRSAAVAVETAFVLPIFLLFLFGIYEFGRLLFTQQVMDAAARETARYAVSVINAETITEQHMSDYARQRMFGMDQKVGNFQLNVEGIALKDGDSHKVGDPPFSWKDAGPTDGVRVRISGNFLTPLPQFIFFGKTITLSSTAVMYSEGN